MTNMSKLTCKTGLYVLSPQHGKNILSREILTKFDRFVYLNIQIYESIVIEFFLRLKIHKMGTLLHVLQELINEIVSVVNQETLD